MREESREKRKKAMGPPIKWTPERLAEVKAKMDEYTEKTQIPILVEFCYQNNINKTAIYDYPELGESIKKLLAKKESVLEKGTLAGKLNASMAIFSLKQMGWSDKQEIEHSGEVSLSFQETVKNFFNQK